MVVESPKNRWSALLSAPSVAIAVILVWPAAAAPHDDGPAYVPNCKDLLILCPSSISVLHRRAMRWIWHIWSH